MTLRIDNTAVSLDFGRAQTSGFGRKDLFFADDR